MNNNQEPLSKALDIREAGPEHLSPLIALFEAASSPCYCRFFHFEGTNNAWLERCALSPDENKSAFSKALCEGHPEARGIVALLEQPAQPPIAVGWLKVAPLAVMSKAYERRLYKNLPCFEGDRTGVFTVGCALVHPAYRHRGIAHALIEGAVHFAPAWGARALEAFPRRPKEPVSDEEMWTGPIGAFAAHGFIEVNSFEPYPVLRREFPRL